MWVIPLGLTFDLAGLGAWVDQAIAVGDVDDDGIDEAVVVLAAEQGLRAWVVDSAGAGFGLSAPFTWRQPDPPPGVVNASLGTVRVAIGDLDGSLRRTQEVVIGFMGNLGPVSTFGGVGLLALSYSTAGGWAEPSAVCAAFGADSFWYGAPQIWQLGLANLDGDRRAEVVIGMPQLHQGPASGLVVSWGHPAGTELTTSCTGMTRAVVPQGLAPDLAG